MFKRSQLRSLIDDEGEEMKLTSKIAATIAAGALAFGMLGVVGCASEEAEEQTTDITTADISAQDIEVTNVGFTVLDNQTVNYAFTVNNPNEGYIADGCTFTIEGYDADGVMLVGGGETIQEIYPGVETGAAGTAFLPDPESQIATFEIKPLMEHVIWTKTDVTSEDVSKMFEVTDVNITAQEDSQEVTGLISADLGEESSTGDAATDMLGRRMNARIVVLLKNSAGEIIGGGSSSSIMLDASMTGFGAAQATAEAVAADEDRGEDMDEQAEEAQQMQEAEAEAEAAEQATGGNSNIATTNFVITIPGNIDYANYQIVVTPGI